MSLRPTSLQGRLLALVTGVVAVVWMATAVITWFDARHELDELLDSHLTQAAALLVVQQSHELEEDHESDEVDAPVLHRYAPKVAFQVYHEGRLVLRSANAPEWPLSPLKDGFETTRVNGADWRVFATRGSENDVQVYVGEQLESRESILWAVMRGTLWPMLFALPALALATWWAVRRGTAPLRALGQALADRQPQALDAVNIPDAPAEMQPMLQALNGLFERIALLLESERRFTADAAHELRTPIAGLRMQAQVALGATGDAERRHALLQTLEGCDRATRLVEQLLTLARLEANATAAATPVELGALVQRVAADLAPQALAKQQTLELDAGADARVGGDSTLLGVLVRNLLDNAVRYSPAGACVQVRVLRTEGGVRLEVEDSGPGLSDADLKRLGERFFRVLGTGEGGSGLGWSIVRRIAAAQGAQVAVRRSAALGGLAVDVSFPATP